MISCVQVTEDFGQIKIVLSAHLISVGVRHRRRSDIYVSLLLCQFENSPAFLATLWLLRPVFLYFFWRAQKLRNPRETFLWKSHRSLQLIIAFQKIRVISPFLVISLRNKTTHPRPFAENRNRKIAAVNDACRQRLLQTFSNVFPAKRCVKRAVVAVEIRIALCHFRENWKVIRIAQATFRC